MNSKKKSMQRLLDDVVVPETDYGHLGPNRSAILEMVSRNRARRRRTKTILGATAGAGACAVVASLFFWPLHSPQQPSPTEPVVHAAPSPPPALTIQEVNDKELLELLKDTPVALMEWPDGKRTLLLTERRRQ
jgi:hypothetical protein